MRTNRFALAMALSVACSDSPTGPATRDLALTVCETNVWVAYQNEGGAWTRLVPGTGGQVTIEATDRLALALTRTTQSPALLLYYIHADQAQAVLGCPQSTEYPRRVLTGTVQGLTTANLAQVTVGRAEFWLDVTSSTFELGWAAAGTRDLIAMRHVLEADRPRADRIIIRRAQSHPDGVVAPIDFESAEAFAPAQSTLSWTGSHTFMLVQYRGANGNNHIVQSQLPGTAGPSTAMTFPLYSVPAAKQISGDRHTVLLHSLADDRSITRVYAEPADMTLAYGPLMPDPVFTPVSISPTLRYKVDIAFQPEYNGYVELRLQGTSPEYPRFIMVHLTREHFGADLDAWSMTIPDLSVVPGVPSGIGLLPSGSVDWSASVTGRPWDKRNVVGDVGDTYRNAFRAGFGLPKN